MNKRYGMIVSSNGSDYIVMDTRMKGFATFAAVQGKDQMIKIFATALHSGDGTFEDKAERIRANRPRLMELPEDATEMKKYVVGAISVKVLGNIHGALLNEHASELEMEDLTEEILSTDAKDYPVDPVVQFLSTLAKAAQQMKMEVSGNTVGEQQWKAGIGKDYYGLLINHAGERYVVVDGAFLGSTDADSITEVLVELFHSEKDREYAAQRIREMNPYIFRFPDKQEDMDKYMVNDLQIPLFGFMQGGRSKETISELEYENVTEKILSSKPVIDENLRSYSSSGGKLL